MEKKEKKDENKADRKNEQTASKNIGLKKGSRTEKKKEKGRKKKAGRKNKRKRVKQKEKRVKKYDGQKNHGSLTFFLLHFFIRYRITSSNGSATMFQCAQVYFHISIHSLSSSLLTFVLVFFFTYISINLH